MQFYSPIVKGKLNDLKALGRITSKARSVVKPMIEAMPLSKGGDVAKHIWKFAHYVVKHVPLGEIYVDFYGLTPGLKVPDGRDAVVAGFDLLKGLGRNVTPAYGFGRDDDLWVQLSDVITANARGFCFRIDIDDLDDQAEETWSQILERSAAMKLAPDQIDLMLDLRYIDDAAMEDLQRVVVDFLALIPRGAPYRSIIIVGSSALKNVGEVPKDGVAAIGRNELLLWSRLERDLGPGARLIFGDYGVIHPDFSDQGPNPNTNAKIRYTDRGRMIYFRGHGLRRPVNDYKQYQRLASQVRDSPHFRGRDFSYGDRYIDMVADGGTTPGSPGTWVLADMNHHIEYTAGQVPILLESVRSLEDELELEGLAELG